MPLCFRSSCENAPRWFTNFGSEALRAAAVASPNSTGNWVDTLAPSPLRPYLRLARADRPIGAWLLLMPCWWSAGLAAVAAGHPYPNPWHVFLFFVGAFVMRGAGCTWNDIVDRDLDAKVARTRSRPIPSGQVSVKAAAIFLVAAGADRPRHAAPVQSLHRSWLGIASLVVVAVYPLAKRVTWWPQIVLGLAFSWGALMGWAAVFGSARCARAICSMPARSPG